MKLAGLLNRVALAVIAMAALIQPGLASETTETTANDDAVALQQAWHEYLDAVREATTKLENSSAYQNDPLGAYDILVGLMIANLTADMSLAATGMRGRPRWGAFDTPNVRHGIDNPDTRYLSAWIPNTNGNAVYKISGNRSNSCDMLFMTRDSTDPKGGNALLEDEDMLNLQGKPLNHGEDYTVYLSTAEQRDEQWHNWMELGASTLINVSSRYTVCNYDNELPGDVTIERLGTEGVALTAEEFRTNLRAVTVGYRKATALMKNQQAFWAGFSDQVQSVGLPANVIAPWRNTGGMGITSQMSNTSWIKLQHDQALVVKVRTDFPAAYGSFMLHNAFSSSLPWGHAMVNGSFEVAGSQGNAYFKPSSIEEELPAQLGGKGEKVRYTYIVISHEDPGVHNWMTPMGLNPVYISGRLQGIPMEAQENISGKAPWMPISHVVPLVAITPGSEVLAKDMLFVTKEQRADQIRQRQKHQRAKYAPW